MTVPERGRLQVIDTADINTGWAEPSERATAVDTALARCAGAADSVAVAYRGERRGDVIFEVETAAASTLRWNVHPDGTWTFRRGRWADEFGRVHDTGLLRPALRGIARTARPDHQVVLDTVVHDVESAADQLIAEARQRRAPMPVRPPTPDELIARTWPSLSESERADLWKMTRLVDVQAGITLMVRDHEGHDVLFLLDGRLEVDTGSDTIRLAPGSVVGEIAAMGNGVRTATVTTLTDAVLLAASGAELAGLPDAVRHQLDRKVVASS